MLPRTFRSPPSTVNPRVKVEMPLAMKLPSNVISPRTSMSACTVTIPEIVMVLVKVTGPWNRAVLLTMRFSTLAVSNTKRSS